MEAMMKILVSFPDLILRRSPMKGFGLWTPWLAMTTWSDVVVLLCSVLGIPHICLESIYALYFEFDAVGDALAR
jgi:hypothetical protein